MPVMRRTLIAIAGAIVAAVLVVGLLSRLDAGSADSRGSHAVTATQVEAFQRALAPLLRTGGEIVEAGMKPGVAEIAGTAQSSADLLGRASSWLESMRGLRTQVANLAVPAGLAGVKSAYVTAFDDYVRTASDLIAAARAVGPTRARLVATAQTDGRAADRAYDAAEAMLRRISDPLHLPALNSASGH